MKVEQTQDRDSVAGAEPKLSWKDALRPTILTGVGLGLLGLASLPLLVSALLELQLATKDDSLRVLPVIAFAVLFTVISFVALAKKAGERELATSYMVPPAIVVIAALALGIALQTDTEKKVEAEAQYAREIRDFDLKMKDPKFVMSLKPPLSLTAKTVIRGKINNANARDSDLTSRQIHALLVNFGVEFESAIGECPKTSPEDLAWIATHGTVLGRQAVAINWATPEPILRRLLKDESPDVSSWAERNAVRRLCDPPLLQSAWERAGSSNLRPDDEIYYSLARNSCTPATVLAALSRSPSEGVSQAAQGTLATRASQRK